LREGDPQRTWTLAEAGTRIAVHPHAGDSQADQIESDRSHPLDGDGVDDSLPLEAVGAHAVVEVEVVRDDLERGVTALGRVGVVTAHDVDW
jgi:hypothetical protein